MTYKQPNSQDKEPLTIEGECSVVKIEDATLSDKIDRNPYWDPYKTKGKNQNRGFDYSSTQSAKNTQKKIRKVGSLVVSGLILYLQYRMSNGPGKK